MIIATLHTPFTLALDFDFNADTNAALKAIGGTWDKAARVWTLPLSRLEKLISRFGAVLMCDTEVWLAMPVQRQEGANLATGRATVDVGSATKFDVLLADGLPRWAAQAERDKVRKGKRWNR